MIGYNLKKMNDILNISYITNENILFIGPPGTAKSLLAKTWAENQNKSFFYYLLSKYTTPDEIFGPISLEDYKKGVVRRITHNKLPEAEIVFLDEVFKASTAILNTLLTVMNEKIFFNPEPIPVKVEMIISASNEIPTEEELLALYDRFLFRYFTDYVGNDELQLLLEFANSNGKFQVETIKKENIKELPQLGSSDIDFIRDTILQLKENGIVISDRRKVKLVNVLRVLKAYNLLTPYYFRLIIETVFPINQKQREKVLEYLDKVLPDIGTIIRKLNLRIDNIIKQEIDVNQKMALLRDLMKEVKQNYKGQYEIISSIEKRITETISELLKQDENGGEEK